MKTTTVSLLGHEFVISTAAEPLLLDHLKQLQRRTRFRPTIYRQNVEALRDVLLTGGARAISKTRLESAITLVGLPDARPMGEKLRQHFPLIRQIIQYAQKNRRQGWQNTLLMLLCCLFIVLATFAGFSALSSLWSDQRSGGWTVTQTSVGPVRSFTQPHQNIAGAWPVGWAAGVVYCVLFVAAAVALWRLRSTQKSMHYMITLLISLCSAFALYSVQRVNLAIPPEARLAQGSAAAPLQPRLAYLQQCGDEIPYVFDSQSAGMLFRQLRDEGFQLSAPIATRLSNGTIDTAELCEKYDVLRRDHPKQNVVLALYSQTADGTLRPYDFSDIENPDVTSSYGLFVKS